MNIKVQEIKKPEEELVIIQCNQVTEEIKDIVEFIRSRNTNLEGFTEEKSVQIQLSDIYYIEAVDNRVFAYLSENIYELKCKLYEFEEAYSVKQFFRCSKQNIVNLMKIESISPAMNGRFAAKLKMGSLS